ncbi:putative bifunctional diguanylate cyclase/phosphodiesterase [Marinomonas atlantica]|uniref:putative bifunctional diguanylate cyclase/phosphodiesterase n=1 Tax=Marinomonas atlantica TaxID=1806668 RepID=UPI00082E60E3|nr:bifunctional diguanylate cyclase/phosphodiesterase [Marinomonas atlantica]
MQKFEDFCLNSIQNPVWIYDVQNFKVYWANNAALNLWEANDLDELISRDFKSGSSDAVTQTLLGYLNDFEAGRIIDCWWRISPKGIDKQVFMRFSGIEIEGNRTAMLAEGIHSEILNRYVGEVGKSAILGLFDNDGHLLSFNPPFKDQFGHEIQTFSDLFSKEIDLTSFVFSEESLFENDYLLSTKKGKRWHRLELSKDIYAKSVIATLNDINERKISELKYAHASITDSLTDLLNRRGLQNKLKKIHGLPYTLFYIDLDGFKPINDSYGHSVGDSLLVKVAEILQNSMHSNSVCARLGGDEFVLIIPEDLPKQQRETIAHKLVQKLSSPMQLDDIHRTLISASIGVAHNRDNITDDPLQVLIYADAALYVAKRSGRNRFISYIPGMEDHQLKRSLIIKELQNAIENNQLKLHYQPIYKTPNSNAVGSEALLRWEHPSLGHISPLEIITAAEETGHIAVLENWVIRRACLDLAELKILYGENFSIGVNISGAHLTQLNFVDDIKSVLEETKTNAKDIVLELTESVLVSFLERGRNTLQELCNLGFVFAIDDFGTGYSSLAYLSQIPASFVKIDKAFTNNIENDPHTIRFIRDLCQNLNMECLIEGVETQEQAFQLDALGIRYRQGYFYARPAPLSQLT